MLQPRYPTGGSFVKQRKVDFGIPFLDALRAQYTTLPDNRPEEKFVVTDSRNVSVSVEVVGNERLEKRLKFVPLIHSLL
jgi:hypothetical protein